MIRLAGTTHIDAGNCTSARRFFAEIAGALSSDHQVAVERIEQYAIGSMANGQNAFISVVGLPFGTNGTSFPVTGDDRDIRGAIFDPVTSKYYYTTAPGGRQGQLRIYRI